MVHRMPIKWKLLSLVFASAVAFMLVIGTALYFLHEAMLTERIGKVRALSEAGRATVQHFQQRVARGELDEAAAQAAALAALRDVRYEGGEYFFIYDDRGTVLLNPTRPDREGKVLLDSADPNGVPFVRLMVEGARQHGGQAVFYSFTKPGSPQPVPKVSFCSRAAWGWNVGTGLYIDDLDQQFRGLALRLLGLVAVIVLLAVAWIAVLSRHIALPLVRLAAVTDRMAGGDHSADAVAVVGPRNDEIGQLAASIRVLRDEARQAEDLRTQSLAAERRAADEKRKATLTLADHFESSVKQTADVITSAAGQMHDAAETMSTAAHQASETAGEVVAAADAASDNVQEAAAATAQLTASIGEITRQVQHSAGISAQAVEQARKTDGLVQGLAQAVARIGEVSQLITDIASQTNLLALNATIEAARAGEAGKGFAVVAGEVKTLANQTARATDEINLQIGAVQTATRDAIGAIQEIGATIATISDVGTAISAAVEEQHAATESISQSVEKAAVGTRKVAGDLLQLNEANGVVTGASRQVLDASRQLTDQARLLDGEVAQFAEGMRAG